MAEINTYNHSDIMRYLQQKMTPQEMHDFEKAMMDDPFLSDAFEGFTKANELVATAHLKDIEKQLTGSNEKAKVVAMPSKKQSWWRIAAIVLVIVLGGALTYNYLRQTNNEVNNAPAFAQKQQQQNKISADTLSVAENEISTLKPIPKQNPLAFKKPNSSSVTNSSPIINSDQNIVEAPPSLMALKTDSAAALAYNTSPMLSAPSSRDMSPQKELRKTTLSSILKEEKTFSGKVTDTTGQPVAYASITASNLNLTTTTDVKGNFSLKAADSVIDVNVNSVGYRQMTAKINSNKPTNNIALKPSDQSLSEVVVVGYGTKRKRNITASAATLSATPEGGWEAFNTYINQSLQHIKDSLNKDSDEDIVVEFSIDNNGRPIDIKILPDTAKENAEKAVEILKKGPRWNREKKNARVKYTFKF